MRNIAATNEQLASSVARGRSLLLFHASWCPYCRAFARVFRDRASGLEDLQPAEVLLDDEDGPLWRTQGIDVVPTLILFADGQEIGRRNGRAGVGLDAGDLEGLLQEAGA